MDIKTKLSPGEVAWFMWGNKPTAQVFGNKRNF